jgi:hypothetical protein
MIPYSIIYYCSASGRVIYPRIFSAFGSKGKIKIVFLCVCDCYLCIYEFFRSGCEKNPRHGIPEYYRGAEAYIYLQCGEWNVSTRVGRLLLQSSPHVAQLQWNRGSYLLYCQCEHLIVLL